VIPNSTEEDQWDIWKMWSFAPNCVHVALSQHMLSLLLLICEQYRSLTLNAPTFIGTSLPVVSNCIEIGCCLCPPRHIHTKDESTWSNLVHVSRSQDVRACVRPDRIGRSIHRAFSSVSIDRSRRFCYDNFPLCSFRFYLPLPPRVR